MQGVEQSCGFNDINQNIFTNHMRSLSCCFLIVCLTLCLTLTLEFALFVHLSFCLFPPLITTPDEFVGGQLSRKLIGSWFWNEFVPIPNLLALDSPDTPPQPILSESHIQNKPKLDLRQTVHMSNSTDFCPKGQYDNHHKMIWLFPNSSGKSRGSKGVKDDPQGVWKASTGASRAFQGPTLGSRVLSNMVADRQTTDWS